MHPILLKLGPFTIYSYGVMVAIGFAVSTFLIYRRAARFDISQDKVIDLAILILVSGIIGARLLYVLINRSFYLANPLDIIKLSKGGLVWYGGFAAALFAVIIYLKNNALDFWEVTDLIAPYIALAQGLGRIGCYLNGCCYGINGFPVQLCASASLFIIFIILLVVQAKRHFVGEIFLGYCILYSLKRFVIEFFRGDNPKILSVFTLSQITSVIIFIAALALFIYKASAWKKRLSNSK
ncbi:MAG: prolipoprotein diacylglyceryl transferase [Candidatus Omnitrophica bacterium]|nr:prolipoprotein diacylglyceryl transferase [Candidatus Omnitrophota bacterium]